MLGLAAAVLFGPFLLITKVNKRINTKISDKAILIHKWWNIRLVKHAKSSFSYIFNNHWEEIKFALSNLLDEEGFAELLDVMKSTCRKTTGGWTVEARDTAKEKIVLLNEKYKIAERAEKMVDKLEREVKLLNCALWAINITAYLVLAMFVIPLVLMFF